MELLMNGCFRIILFAILSKIIIMPVSLWVQKNSIKLVGMQPEINNLKVRYFGDKDRLAEEQAKFFKQEHYNPLASLIPLLLQLLLLMAVIELVKAGIQNPAVNMVFWGIDLGLVPADTGLKMIWSPLAAGASAWILCIAQNHSNVLQSEQSLVNKYGTMIFSVGLSVYLGWFVPAGIAVYWILSNLLAILQMYFLNWLINPEKIIDYELLEKSKENLLEINSVGKSEKRRWNSIETRKEKEDCKKFNRIVNKHLVFYSEGKGFYKYYQGVIEYILEHSNIIIHYITSDFHDPIFESAEKENRLKAYYIGEKRLITVMMKIEADIVVMTMPDLENYHIKRSYIQKDIEYVYIPHGMNSLNMTLRTGSTDHFDTIFCTGKHQKEELEKTEQYYGNPKRKMIEWGYCLLDQMRADYSKMEKKNSQVRNILIAPSWQKDNIIETCLNMLLDSLRGNGYMIVVRPHPQQIKQQSKRIEQLKARYAEAKDILIQTDFSSNSTVYEADLVITDWSGIAFEYAFTTYKPILFVDTPVKIMNSEYKKIGIEPFNFFIREKIGIAIKPDEAPGVLTVVQKLFASAEIYHDQIAAIAHEYVYNLDHSAGAGARYLMEQIKIKTEKRKQEK